MKCIYCKHNGSAANMRHGAGGWACMDRAKCLGRVRAARKTPSKRAAWKKQGQA